MAKKKMTKNTKLVLLLLAAAVILAIIPLMVNKDAGFGGTDDAGSVMAEEISGTSEEPWFTPVVENILGRELPGEVETLLFCVQTGIGTGILAFFMGRFVERKKWMDKEAQKKEDNE